MAFKKALIERALGVELGHNLGYPAGRERPEEVTNQRNGNSRMLPKHERRFFGFDDKITAMYARGMTVREIRGFLAEQYGTEVSPAFIGSVLTRSWTRSGPGRPVLWRRCIRWCSSMRCGSRSARTAWCATSPCTWRWRCRPTARATSWACESSRPKAPSSG